MTKTERRADEVIDAFVERVPGVGDGTRSPPWEAATQYDADP
jgi:hypothetical protein